MLIIHLGLKENPDAHQITLDAAESMITTESSCFRLDRVQVYDI